MVCLTVLGTNFRLFGVHYSKAIKWAGTRRNFTAVSMVMKKQLKTESGQRMIMNQQSQVKKKRGPRLPTLTTFGAITEEKGGQRRTRGARHDIDPKSRVGLMRCQP